jgi:hypothetical protein
MESARALGEIYSHAAGGGISIDSGSIACPCLIIKAVNSDLGERQGRAAAQLLHGDYAGFPNFTHTGLLVGQRYLEVVDRLLEWLERFQKAEAVSYPVGGDLALKP